MDVAKLRGDDIQRLCRIGLAPILVDSLPSPEDLRFFLRDSAAPDIKKARSWLEENRELLLEKIRDLKRNLSIEAEEGYYEVILGPK